MNALGRVTALRIPRNYDPFKLVNDAPEPMSLGGLCISQPPDVRPPRRFNVTRLSRFRDQISTVCMHLLPLDDFPQSAIASASPSSARGGGCSFSVPADRQCRTPGQSRRSFSSPGSPPVLPRLRAVRFCPKDVVIYARAVSIGGAFYELAQIHR